MEKNTVILDDYRYDTDTLQKKLIGFANKCHENFLIESVKELNTDLERIRIEPFHWAMENRDLLKEGLNVIVSDSFWDNEKSVYPDWVFF